MKIIAKPYVTQHSCDEMDRIFGHGKPSYMIELVEIINAKYPHLIQGLRETVQVDVREIVDVENAATFDEPNRLLIEFKDHTLFVVCDYIELKNMVHTALYGRRSSKPSEIDYSARKGRYYESPILKLFRAVDGSPVEIDASKITEEPEDVSTFDDKDRVLITCDGDSFVVRGSCSDIGIAIYNASRLSEGSKEKNIKHKPNPHYPDGCMIKMIIHSVFIGPNSRHSCWIDFCDIKSIKDATTTENDRKIVSIEKFNGEKVIAEGVYSKVCELWEKCKRGEIEIS
ncbi:MAG TPA: hypothetical protein ENH82_06870 [bacterium]|nr:hypothetical protein [bacterium]